jgi:hypothetical protein
MAESVVFRPRSAGLGLGMVALPLLSAITVLLGVAAVLELNPIVGLSIFIVCQLIALVPLLLLARLLLGLFALQVDPDALTIVGRYGASSLRLPWSDLYAVGLADWRGNQMLAVQPLKPFTRSPKRVLVWDRDLLLIATLDNWSATRDEMLATLRRHAGDRWVEHLEVGTE